MFSGDPGSPWDEQVNTLPFPQVPFVIPLRSGMAAIFIAKAGDSGTAATAVYNAAVYERQQTQTTNINM